MALSELEAQKIEDRFLAIERKLNEIQTAINNLASKDQLISNLNLRQAEILDLKKRVTTLESQVAALLSS